MNVLFTCGGTAGHINPALAIAKLLRERHPEAKILFVGADGGMETELVPREGYEIRTVTITNFRRKLSPEGLRHNLKTLSNMNLSRKQANAILDEFRPDVVVGTGGYASFPVGKAAQKRGIPTAIHESNATPGLTTKALAQEASCVMVGFEESRAQYEHPERVIVTGTPVRGEFFRWTREEAKAKLGLSGKPVVLSFWGSLGAQEMNRKMGEMFRLECGQKPAPFHHIHAAGRKNWEWMPGYLKELGLNVEEEPSLDVREYIYDMDLCMAAADLVICRAGAATLSELTALHKPAILVPSPNVTDNHQEKNARVLERRGAARVLLDQEVTGESLYREALAILEDPAALSAMARAMEQAAVPDAAERIYEAVLKLI